MGSELELAAGRQAMFHLPSILIGGLLKLSLETRYANIVVTVSTLLEIILKIMKIYGAKY